MNLVRGYTVETQEWNTSKQMAKLKIQENHFEWDILVFNIK